MYGRANWNEIKCFVNLANVKTHTLLHVPQVSFLNSNLYCHYQLTFNNKTIHTANQKLYKFLTFNFIFHNLFISKYCNNYNCTVMQIRHCNCIVISTYPSSATPLCCCILITTGPPQEDDQRRGTLAGSRCIQSLCVCPTVCYVKLSASRYSTT